MSGIVFLILSYIGFNTNTTGDNGDSVMHYLFSHYALEHPENYLDHWAKPLFVLLSSPFAYFGFKGMILFNVICVSLTALFTFYVAKEFKLKYALLVFPFFLSAPLFFKLTFSGLTEYLFGLLIVLGIFLSQKNKKAVAMIIISFLPMVRSEGLIVIGVFGLYALLERQFKLIPLLLTGQLFYTIVGAIYYEDLLWVFHKIPYANMGSPYGHGGLFDFAFKLMYVIEKPLFLLFSIGLGIYTYQFLKVKKGLNKHVLVAGTALALLIAHSIFWYFGIFNSMGLPRVLIVIVPLVLIVVVEAIEILLKSISSEKIRIALLTGVSLIVIGFPFVNKVNGIVYQKNMFAVEDHDMIDEELKPFIVEELPSYQDKQLFFSHPYLSVALDVDYFNRAKHEEMQHVFEEPLSPGTIVIWDSWFSVSDGGIKLDSLLHNPQLEVKGSFSRKSENSEFKFVVFESHE